MTATFTIPGRLSGTNDIIRRAAWNRFAGGAQRKKEKMICAHHILSQNGLRKARFTKPVGVSFAWIEPNGRRDLDNIMGGQKVIFDALVMLGILPDDTPKWVKGISHTFPAPNKLCPRIVITINDDELS